MSSAIALGVAAGLFVLWAVVGYPIVNELLDGVPLRTALLAPVGGLCALTAPVAVLNHVGFPVRAVGPPVLWLALAGATAYYLRRRPRVPWRELRPFWFVAGIAFALAAWPMLLFGLDWLSFGNDDMTTYLLGGNHFYAHGYFQLPPANDLMNERDPSWDTSFFYSFDEVRYAAPLMLAWVMSVFRLSSGAAFMPMVVALHLVAVAAAGALVASRKNGAWVALATCGLLAVSANSLSGTLRQLLPQDFGLAVLAAAVTTLFRPLPATRETPVKGATLGSLFTGTLVIAYPEVLPFFLGPAAIYVALSIRREPSGWRAWTIVAAIVTGGVLLVANENIPGAIALFVKQAAVASATGAAYDRILFAHFLTPLIFPLFWGLSTIGSPITPWTALAVLVAMGATAGAYVLAVRYTLALEPAATVLLVMLLLLLALIWNGASFGVFKLAMYAQPFLLGTIACWLIDRTSARLRSTGA